MKDKMDTAYLEDLRDNEETVAELKRKQEQEKLMLLTDNKKLMMDLNSLTRARGESWMMNTKNSKIRRMPLLSGRPR